MKQLMIAVTFLGLMGCSSIVSGLRPDQDDTYSQDRAPTSGGRWAEGGMLNDEDAVNRSAPGRLGGQGTWMDSNNNNSSRQYSGGDSSIAYSNTPNYMVAQKRAYKNGQRATRADFIDDAKVDGSLWNSDGQTNYYLTKNKVRGIGDIVAITVDDGLIADVATEIKRNLTPDERETEVDLLQEETRKKLLGQSGATAESNRTPASEGKKDGEEEKKKSVDVPTMTFADVDLKKNIEMKAGENVMAEVVERYPNGNYKIRGVKRVRYKNGYRLMNIMAIAKNSDITEDDQIPAGKLYEYRLEAIR